jgi:hypothetical protein
MRKVIAILEVDEDFAESYAETNGLSYDGPLSWLETEAHWIEDSGIRLSDALISDADDESDWWRYLNYLADWIFESHSEDNEGKSPMSYEAWMIYESSNKINSTHITR